MGRSLNVFTRRLLVLQSAPQPRLMTANRVAQPVAAFGNALARSRVLSLRLLLALL